MFSSLLQKIKDRMTEAQKPLKKESISEGVPASQSSLDTSTPDILAYVDTHGTVDKDSEIDTTKDAELADNRVPNSSKGPMADTLRKIKPATPTQPIGNPTPTVEDLSIFDDEDSLEGADAILAYVDSHGIETKVSDQVQKAKEQPHFTRTKKAHELTIDLHGLRKEGAQLRIKRAFKEAKVSGAGQLLIIHGRGNHNAGGRSPLKEMVYALLEIEYANQVKSYGFAPPSEGGGGATRVVLK